MRWFNECVQYLFLLFYFIFFVFISSDKQLQKRKKHCRFVTKLSINRKSKNRGGHLKVISHYRNNCEPWLSFHLSHHNYHSKHVCFHGCVLLNIIMVQIGRSFVLSSLPLSLSFFLSFFFWSFTLSSLILPHSLTFTQGKSWILCRSFKGTCLMCLNLKAN